MLDTCTQLSVNDLLVFLHPFPATISISFLCLSKCFLYRLSSIYISHGTLLHHWLCTRIDAPVNLLEHWELEVCWHELLIGTSVKGNVHFKHVHQMITGLYLSYILFLPIYTLKLNCSS